VDIGPVGAGKPAPFRLGHRQHVAAVIADPAQIGALVAGKARQKRRLAGAAFPDDPEDLAGEQVEGHVRAADAGAIAFRQAFDVEKRLVSGRHTFHERHSAASGSGAQSRPFFPCARRPAQKSVSEQTNIRPP
jgi:hypothetical protein